MGFFSNIGVDDPVKIIEDILIHNSLFESVIRPYIHTNTYIESHKLILFISHEQKEYTYEFVYNVGDIVSAVLNQPEINKWNATDGDFDIFKMIQRFEWIPIGSEWGLGNQGSLGLRVIYTLTDYEGNILHMGANIKIPCKNYIIHNSNFNSQNS